MSELGLGRGKTLAAKEGLLTFPGPSSKPCLVGGGRSGALTRRSLQNDEVVRSIGPHVFRRRKPRERERHTNSLRHIIALTAGAGAPGFCAVTSRRVAAR